MSEEPKTPEESATREINKLIGKSIAKRRLQIRRLEAEIAKLKSGELAPDADESPFHHNQYYPIQTIRPTYIYPNQYQKPECSYSTTSSRSILSTK